MRIKRIKITNFKGIENLELNLDNKDVSIYGDNATGKSTIGDAITWLLFGKNQEWKTNFNMKPVGQTNLEVIVEAEFLINDSVRTFKRVHKEKYTRKTGDTAKELTGHITNYFINDAPAKEKEYSTAIQEICNEETFKILIHPFYFSSLNWVKQREIICKIIDMEEIEKSLFEDSKFNLIKDFLDNYEESRKKLNSAKREINEKLKELPIRINELKRNLVQADEYTTKQIMQEIAEYEEKTAQIENEKENQYELLTVEKESLLNKINGLQDDILKEKKKLSESGNEQLKNIKKVEGELRNLENYLSNHNENIVNLEGAKGSLSVASQLLYDFTTKKTELELRIINMREEWKELSKSTPEIDLEQKTCNSCGQDLPVDLLSSKMEELENKFNEEKKTKLESINKNGKKIKSTIENLDKRRVNAITEIEKVSEIKTEIENKINSFNEEEVNEKIKETKEKLKNMQENSMDITDNDIIISKKKEIEELKNKLSGLKIKDNEEHEKELVELKANIKQLETKLLKIETNQQQTERIEELKAELKKHSDMEIDVEEKIILLNNFYIEKMKRIEDKLKVVFDEKIGFKVFDQLINGSIKESFEITVDGVPWNSVNTSDKIRTGMKMIDVFSKFYNFSPFVIIDNAEALTSFPVISNQMIKLFVSGKDKKLRIENE